MQEPVLIMTFCNLSMLDCTFASSNCPILIRYHRSHGIAHHIGTEHFRECGSPHRTDVSSFCAVLRCDRDAMRCCGADGREPEKSTNRTSRGSRPNMLADRRSNYLRRLPPKEVKIKGPWTPCFLCIEWWSDVSSSIWYSF